MAIKTPRGRKARVFRGSRVYAFLQNEGEYCSLGGHHVSRLSWGADLTLGVSLKFPRHFVLRVVVVMLKGGQCVSFNTGVSANEKTYHSPREKSMLVQCKSEIRVLFLVCSNSF